MIINFSKVILHNFLSYGHAEINLNNLGYCLVKGVNNCPKDNALSNGSGKSSWVSALCWALTGQTIQGVTSNIQNIYVPEKLCYVTLEFSVDKNNYKITRYKAPKPDLKIIIDDEDKSGKGLRESETVLAEYLPDITPNLIASVIILGQGLPYKFSDNTPAGRKEVLEKLTKSDFMIQDLKNKVSARIDILDAVKRKHEDELLSNNSKISLLNSQLIQIKDKLEKLAKPQNFDEQIQTITLDINQHQLVRESRKQKLDEGLSKAKSLTSSLEAIISEKSEKEKIENNDFNEFNSAYLSKKYELSSEIKNLKDKINQLKSIKDVCPTCGQKLPGVEKPDTSVLETELAGKEEKNIEIIGKYDKNKKLHEQTLLEIGQEYASKLNSLKNEISILEIQNSDLDGKIRSDDAAILTLSRDLSKIILQKESYEKEIENTKNEAEKCLNTIKNLENSNKEIDVKKQINDSHLDVLSQMMTLIKRDFRGFLLSNIISFIDLKAKEYAQTIFNTNELDFKLEGNNIDIAFCNKPLETLSGGEKQKVNLIIQFAIRDMMSKYLNFASNILILDEITDNLDTLGCNKLLDLISTKLVDVESIFLISHHPDELELPIDYELTVVKNKEGVSTIR